MKKFLIVAFLATCLPAVGQGSRYDSNVFTVNSNVPIGASAPMLAVPNAKVTICSTPAVGNPCTNSVTIYSNPSLTVAAANPIAADGQGRYGFFVVAGNYSFSVCTSTCKTGMLTVGGGAPGASGITSLTGDVLASGTGSTTSALAVVNSTPGLCGDATHTSQITVDGKGRTISCTPIAIAGSGGSSSTTEVPAGTVNGSNTAFTLSNIPILLLLTNNGLLLSTGTDYTNTGTALTISPAPQTGDALKAQYFYGTSTTSTPFVQVPTGTINGSNSNFTLAHIPQILYLSRNGIMLSASTDYTIAGSTLTMTTAPITGDIFNAQYFY
jgi:hypothetical protein